MLQSETTSKTPTKGKKMRDSDLVTSTVLTNNHSNGRNSHVCAITPHYMCWYTDGETCAESFVPASRQASANYCIGKYGDIVLNVHEDDRAWTSGNAYNDNRAITIECANHMETADGHVYGQLPSATWKSLVDLCADICQRYGRTNLVYTGGADWDAIGPADMLLTKHCWFQSTDCPGPWLTNQFARLAAEVNAKLQGTPRLTVAKALAETMYHLVTHSSHGYSQPNRQGNGMVEVITLSDGTKVRLPDGDKDCSEAVRCCLAGLGLVAYDYWDSYMWTGNEDEVLTAAGFKRVPVNSVREGDIMWKPGHTEMVIVVDGVLMDAGFRRSETGGTDGEQGDQTGRESMYSPHPAYGWERCYRYAGDEREQEEPSGQTEDEMICIIHPNDKSYLAYFDGQQFHPLAHPDEAEALNKVYQATHGGKSIPHLKLGTKNAPWATRLVDAISRVSNKA